MTSAEYTIEYIHADTSLTYNPQDIERFTTVDQGDFETGTSPMLSEGFYNCVAVIGLSKSTALLGHFQRIDVPNSGSYKEFGDAIRALAEVKAHTVILGGGGMFYNPNDIERATADRAFAEKAAQSALPAADIIINWNEEYNGRQDILVFPESGKIVIYNATTTFVV